MVYHMIIYVDGGCRGNGQPGSIGAAAAVFKLKWGRQKIWTRALPQSPRPTNQRAELCAIILALEQALAKYKELKSDPFLNVKIYSDSRYAIGCMTKWLKKWSRNGWRNAAGREVANRDLIQRASYLQDKLSREGNVRYLWVPRDENETADEACNERMDKIEEEWDRWT